MKGRMRPQADLPDDTPVGYAGSSGVCVRGRTDASRVVFRQYSRTSMAMLKAMKVARASYFWESPKTSRISFSRFIESTAKA